MLLLEDVDAAFAGPRQEEAPTPEPAGAVGAGMSRSRTPAAGTGITFSGLLNAIDGVAAQEGKVLFLTTNHFERLDPALVRPGRVDVRCFFGLASRDSARKLFLRFFSSEGPSESGYSRGATAKASLSDEPAVSELEVLAANFSEGIPDRTYSMATLQGHLMAFRESPDKAVTEIGRLSQAAEGASTAQEDTSVGLPLSAPGFVRNLSTE